eukprot:gnl/Hemi2/10295_TR3550_c0_g1_i1.p1 gnl/Hemi2/10295_TR3550_c0_g1~~gnl/Hemi2/10295_TR3550_c0_g1_i1.p1  ORF type:complete len:453 (-),score=-22.62 gnl/Hemi2/10295_TR3550_c0_g1_i1:133-1491(-)
MKQFLFQIDELGLDQKSRLGLNYYFYAGFAVPAYLNTPKGLKPLFDVFEMLSKMESVNMISYDQKERIFQTILMNPKLRVEKEFGKLLNVNTYSIEEFAESNAVQGDFYDLYYKVEALIANNGSNLLPSDLVFCGFLVYHASNLANMIFEKLVSLRALEASGSITKDQKINMYELLFSIVAANIQDYFDNLQEKESLVLKSPSTSADSGEHSPVELHAQSVIEFGIYVKEESKSDPKECKICLEDSEGALTLEICGHSFHKACIEEYVQVKMNENKFPILCPEEHCKAELTNSDLEKILKFEDMQKFHRLSVAHFLNMNASVVFHCPTPDCAFKLFYAEPSQKEVECPLCLNTFCLACKEHSHPNALCEVNQFIKIAKDLALKACPSCRHWVEKTEGCNHMTCNCGYEFCYNCGRIYDFTESAYGGPGCVEGYCEEKDYYEDFEKLLNLQEG